MSIDMVSVNDRYCELTRRRFFLELLLAVRAALSAELDLSMEPIFDILVGKQKAE
jgi:hypothetical protein